MSMKMIVTLGERGVVHSCQTGEEELCVFLFIILLLVYLSRVLLSMRSSTFS